MTATAARPTRKQLSAGAKRGIWIGIIVLVLAGIVLGTKVVSNDEPLAQGAADFDPATFGAENFPTVRDGITERATDAVDLAAAIAEDPAAAAEEFAVSTSGGPNYSVSFTGVVGAGQSGIYPVTVEGVPSTLLIRMQTGPAINGTELRDATGDIQFGQFKNQIDYQNAASALNEQLKTEVLANIDAANLEGKTVSVTGSFTLVNPAGWLVTPVEIEVQ